MPRPSRLRGAPSTPALLSASFPEASERTIEIRPGDTIYTPPGEWHWHGAGPDYFMIHLAMWEGPADPDLPETQWGEHVTDQEYGAK